MNFGSDNTSAVHPKVMDALIAANEGHAPSYGTDEWTARAEARIRDVFEASEAEIYLVASGTATNALALAAVSRPWGKIFCHRGAHVETSECNAVPFYSGGADLVPVTGYHGRIAPGALEAALEAYGRPDVHAGEQVALTLTNSTEAGTIYDPRAIKRLAGIAHAAGMAVHMDGARLANALAALKCSPADLTHRAGVDILSLGGTKNGAMSVEAIVVFDPSRTDNLGMRRMRGGHLWSKHRFLAAQMLALLEDDLWLALAGHANAMAARFAAGLEEISGVTLDHPVEANQIFAAIPRDNLIRAREAGLVCHNWPFIQPDDADPRRIRLVCSWATTEGEVDAALSALR